MYPGTAGHGSHRFLQSHQIVLPQRAWYGLPHLTLLLWLPTVRPLETCRVPARAPTEIATAQIKSITATREVLADMVLRQ